MRLAVLSLVLAAVVGAAWLTVDHVAPERRAAAAEPIRSAPAAAGTVEAVRFLGPGLRAAFLADEVTTRAGHALSPATLASDRRRIVAALVARGHLDATADAPVVEWSGAGTAYVDFPVDTGPVYVIRSIRLDGRLAARHPALAGVPTLAAGEPVAASRIETSAALLRGWLAEHGVAGHVRWNLDVQRPGQQVDVVFTVW